MTFNWRGAAAFAHDAVACGVVWLAAFWLRSNFGIPQPYVSYALDSLAPVVVVHMAAFYGFGLYRGAWRFAGLPDLRRILTAVGVAAIAVPVALIVLRLPVPRSVLIMNPLLLVMVMGGSRLAFGAWERRLLNRLPERELRMMIGHAAAMIGKIWRYFCKIWRYFLAPLLPLCVGMWLVSYFLPPSRPIYDGAQYFAMAYNMAKYNVSSISEKDTPDIRPDYLREPVPSFLMSLVIRATADERDPLDCYLSPEMHCARVVGAVSYVNVVSFGALILVVYGAVLTLSGSVVAALLGSLLMATSSVFPSIARLCTSETPAALLVVLHAWLLYLAFARDRPRIGFAVGSGLALGALILTKAVYLYWCILLVAALPLAIILVRRRTGRDLRAAALAVSLSAILVAGAWIARNWIHFGQLTVAGRGAVVLAVRAEYGLISWREYAAGYLFFTPYVGPQLAEEVFGDTANAAFQFGRPTAIETLGRQYLVTQRTSAPTCEEWKKKFLPAAEAAQPGSMADCEPFLDEVVRESARVIRENWVMQAALVPLMFYRQMFIGGCCQFEYNQIPPYWLTTLDPDVKEWYDVLVDVLPRVHIVITLVALCPLFLLAVLTWAQRRQYGFLLFCAPAAFHLLFHAALTNGYPRFSEPLLPLLVAVLAVFLATAIPFRQLAPFLYRRAPN